MFFNLAERTALTHPFGVGGELAHGLNIGGEPSQPMGGALLAVEQAAVGLACDNHPLAHFGRGVAEQSIKRACRLVAEVDQIEFSGGSGSGDGHENLGTADVSGADYMKDSTRAVHKSKVGLELAGFPALSASLNASNCYKINHFKLSSRGYRSTAPPAIGEPRTSPCVSQSCRFYSTN